MPERPEEIPLERLCEALSVNHGGKLGKTTNTLVSKMISSKLPGDYGQTKLRQILKERWGLGPGRQDAALLLALTKQPASRLASSQEAEAFLAEVGKTYYAKEGLALPSSGPSQSQGGVVDVKALQMVNEQNTSLVRAVMQTLGAHIDSTTQATDAAGTDTEQAAQNAVQLLDDWVLEHGEEYADGIASIFEAKKERLYDSYWNWNAQDIRSLVQSLECRQLKHAELMGQLSIRIVNRACDRSVEQLNYMITKEKENGNRGREIKDMLQILQAACLASKDRDPMFVNTTPDLAPLTSVDEQGSIVFSENIRNDNPQHPLGAPGEAPKPFEKAYPIKISCNGVLVHSEESTHAYAADLEAVRHSGLTFQGKNVLLTGAGRNSIGFHLLKCLLEGGARVTVTTSSYSTETMEMYQSLYASHGARGSVLRVVPFNQGSQRDVKALIEYLDRDESWDLDFIVPFAARSENGRDVENLDSRSEIAHRMMLTNLLRMLGAVARSKRARNIVTRPATVVLPLSPNHGLMGNDGLYSESKMSLESLLPKWTSESWNEYLSLIGVTIGWTRGTGLMNDNDVVAQAVEAMGVRTFAAAEMAANIATAMGGVLNVECQSCPILLDLGGGLGDVQGFKEKLTIFRSTLNTYADTQRAIMEERRHDARCIAGPDAGKIERIGPRANLRLPLPPLGDYDRDISPLASTLEGMVDLSRVVVITGFAELGPHGNSRTRWEMETNSSLSTEGCIEMAWIMGLIKQKSGVGKNGSVFSEWVDTKTMEPVAETDVPNRYMATILEHSGIRKIEPDVCDGGYDPERKEGLQELALQQDMPPFEASAQAAEELQRRHGRHVVVTKDASGVCQVQLKAGATVMIPRSSRFNRTVAGQIPTGWSPKRYGISDDIIEQVDPVTLFSLVCTVEAFLCSGIVDPYEWYQHMHVSELGNCVGSSMGGLSSLRKMHRDRFVDKAVKGDVLQETFINTTGAWINMLLTSSAGPIRTPVGACATALESLDTGYDLIISKKAKICIVGGVEDFVEDVSFEFGSMKATCDTDAEFAAGRSPREMSRPTASSRSGFVESQGCGIQVITSAELALKMGLPIFGVVAYSNMAADKAGRSVPAPGKGVLTNAREPALTRELAPLPILDLNHRRKLLNLRRQQIAQQKRERMALLSAELSYLKASGAEELEEHRLESISAIEEEAARQDADATFDLGQQFWKGDQRQRISPLRGSLATWGLGIDDISVASLHGTSTVQNDLNETMVIQEQLRHLGRRAGNVLPCVCQKWLTGHGKGAAGAWMLNGCLQMMSSGLVPGNRNCDNVDQGLRKHPHLFFPNKPLQLGERDGGVKACSITSFGFGQKGAQALLVNPRYLFATISKERYQEYARERNNRWHKACRAFSEGMVLENMVSARIKDQPPYAPGDEVAALLDSTGRY